MVQRERGFEPHPQWRYPPQTPHFLGLFRLRLLCLGLDLNWRQMDRSPAFPTFFDAHAHLSINIQNLLRM